MKQFIQKDILINCAKNFIHLIRKIKYFILELPPGYLEYRNAILTKDESFNFLENDYFKRHILPRIKNHTTLDKVDHSATNNQILFTHNTKEPFRVNPVTGLPMIGAYDSGGNAFGFNYNQSFHNHLTPHSTFNHMSSFNSFNSSDYWK